ncbi:glycosyltransferase family 4 protein [Hymenobacter sp. NBH84]|uniref:glycosyltransferase family 4 protein n=1 Tax=Hymenobacter sp. NBH84 TaxID=2596915 RepID=UPI001628229C|nr:glycosyltransferase family 4 protein [Hymenobacter sp. NBH84]QNE38268.1 glycosyltransferase family 4 protein [Hymenobacter sp. NBH84]
MVTQRKIRVLESIRQGAIGGGETHVLDVVRLLDKNRYEPIVLSFTPGPMVDRLRAMGITTHVIETEKPFNFLKWQQVKQLLKQERIDIVHAHGTRAGSNTFWAAKRLGLPIIYTVHGWSFHVDQQPLVLRIRQLGEKLLLKQASVTVCVSESNYQDGLAFSDMRRAVVIKNGVDLTKYDPARSFTDIRAELGLPANRVLIGYIARITVQKDPFTLLRAIALLPADIPATFLLVGDGDLKAAAVQLAQELQLGSRVVFLAARQDIPDFLRALDIYCLPSLWEGLSLGLLEAMAMGKAVVATAIDGTREVIQDTINGLLIPARSPEKLAEALTKLIGDETLRRELGREARQTVQMEFNAVTMTRQVEQLYERVLPLSLPTRNVY